MHHRQTSRKSPTGSAFFVSCTLRPIMNSQPIATTPVTSHQYCPPPRAVRRRKKHRRRQQQKSHHLLEQFRPGPGSRKPPRQLRNAAQQQIRRRHPHPHHQHRRHAQHHRLARRPSQHRRQQRRRARRRKHRRQHSPEKIPAIRVMPRLERINPHRQPKFPSAQQSHRQQNQHHDDRPDKPTLC